MTSERNLDVFPPADPRLDPLLHVIYNETVSAYGDGLGLLVDILERGRPDWHTLAACRSSDLDFTTRVASTRSKCIQVCGTCDVRTECLAWALEIGDTTSVLGGMDPAARARLAREATT